MESVEEILVEIKAARASLAIAYEALDFDEKEKARNFVHQAALFLTKAEILLIGPRGF